MSMPDAAPNSPFENPMIRHAIGFSGAILLIVVGVFFFEPPITYLFVAIAVLDAVLVPKLLERSVESDEGGSSTI